MVLGVEQKPLLKKMEKKGKSILSKLYAPEIQLGNRQGEGETFQIYRRGSLKEGQKKG